MRLIDADELKERILKERDAIPKTVVERYSFGVGIPNSHGNSMRGGIRKALRCMEQTPTINPESLRPKGRWEHINKHLWYKEKNGMVDIWRVDYGFHNGPECEVCHKSFCMHCTPDWEEQVCEVGYYVCSNCGEVSKKNTPYCPNCGADMREVKDENHT